MLRPSVFAVAYSIVMFLPSPSPADVTGSPGPNQLYGHITSDRTLTQLSPGPNYEIIGDLTIDPGVTLTIERNVSVQATPFSDYLASGSDRSKVELVVRGTLRVPAGSGAVVIGSTQNTQPYPWYGIDVDAGGQVNLYNTSISDGVTVLHVRGGGAATLNNSSISRCFRGLDVDDTGSASLVECNIEHCSDAGAHIQTGGSLTALHTTTNDVLSGFVYEHGALGDVRACRVFGAGSGAGGEGLVLPFNLSPADSVSPEPNQVGEFRFGIRVTNSDFRLDHVIINNCYYAFHDDYGRHVLNYCTLAQNAWNVYGSGRGEVLNTIMVAGAFLQNDAVNYVDWWGISGGAWGAVTPGNVLSSFDPFFVANDGALHLHPASLFTNFSVSGGEIGAYGPGPVGPTPVLGASVVDAEGTGGVVRISWFSQSSGNSKAGIVRRSGDGEWQPLKVLYPDGEGYLTLEDRDVVPGVSYGYGVCVQRGSNVGVDGEVWVTVEAAVNALSVASIGPNPAAAGWSITFYSPGTAGVQIEAVDVAGRIVRSVGVGAVGPGRQTAYLSAKGIRPGVYWIRVRVGSQIAQAKAVKVE